MQTYPLEPCDLEAGASVHWTEQLRHKILLLRLQRPYFIYCLLCSLLAAAAFLSTLVDVWKSGADLRERNNLPEGTPNTFSTYSTCRHQYCAEYIQLYSFTFSALGGEPGESQG